MRRRVQGRALLSPTVQLQLRNKDNERNTERRRARSPNGTKNCCECLNMTIQTFFIPFPGLLIFSCRPSKSSGYAFWFFSTNILPSNRLIHTIISRVSNNLRDNPFESQPTVSLSSSRAVRLQARALLPSARPPAPCARSSTCTCANIGAAEFALASVKLVDMVSAHETPRFYTSSTETRSNPTNHDSQRQCVRASKHPSHCVFSPSPHCHHRRRDCPSPPIDPRDQ